MEKSESIDQIATALAKAQGEFEPLLAAQRAKVKMKAGGEYGYSYADLADTLEVCRPALARNGIAVFQDLASVDRGVDITTWLFHESGQWLKSSVLTMAFNGGPQELGSAATYGRRYQYQAVVGIAPKDDDGQAAKAAGSASRKKPSDGKWEAGVRAWGARGVGPDVLLEIVKRRSPSELSEADHETLESLFVQARDGNSEAVDRITEAAGRVAERVQGAADRG